jgi:outer membrane immunogenic protein
MKRAISLGIGAVALAGLTFPSAAADLGARPITKAPVMAPAPVFTWTGCYVGGNVGFGFSNNNDMTLAPSADPVSTAFWGPAFAAGAAPSLFPLGPNGVIGGGQVGCNWQMGAFVLGLETDFQGSGMDDTVGIATAVPGFAPGVFTASQSLDWFGTVRGRLGFAAGPWLFYGTGGLAYGRVGYGLNFAFPATADFHTIGLSNTETGWTAGGGIEWAFAPNWSIKAEYLFIDLGDTTIVTAPSGRAANLATTLTSNFSNQYQLVRLGVNWKFGSLFGAPY